MSRQEETIIERIIRYSNIILKAKISKQLLMRSKMALDDVGIILYEKSKLLEVSSELERKILEVNKEIKKLLLPLFDNRIIIGYNDQLQNWGFSSEEMKQGYVILDQVEKLDSNGNPIGSSVELILFLSDFKDRTNNIKAGEIIPKNKIAHLLGNQKSVLSKSCIMYRKILKV